MGSVFLTFELRTLVNYLYFRLFDAKCFRILTQIYVFVLDFLIGMAENIFQVICTQEKGQTPSASGPYGGEMSRVEFDSLRRELEMKDKQYMQLMVGESKKKLNKGCLKLWDCIIAISTKEIGG